MTAEYSLVLHAPAQRVFDAITQPDELTRWWGDDSVYWMTHVEQELHAGGAANYMFAFNHGDDVSGSSAGRTSGSHGVTTAADPPHMLEYTRKYDDGFPCSEETVIRYDLQACAEGTRLTVTHSGFASQDMVELHRHGWERVFEWLDGWLRVRRDLPVVAE